MYASEWYTKTLKMSFRLFVLSFLLFVSLNGFGQNSSFEFKGKIVDQRTKEPLPNASLQINGTLRGTVANLDGEFTLKVPSDTHSVTISFLGYEDEIITPKKGRKKSRVVALKPWKFELKEVVVTPKSPEEYIRAAVEAFEQNFSSSPFMARAYFLENASITSDSGSSYKENKAVITSHYENYIDTTIEAQHRIDLLHRDSSGVLTTILSGNARLRRAMEDNESDGEDMMIKSKNGAVDIDLPVGEGPQIALDVARSVIFSPFFQPKYFKKFKYSFGEPSFYKNRELISIDFKSKRKVDYSKYLGTVYLDLESLAIVSVQYRQDIKLPFYVNLLIRPLVGFSIKNIQFNINVNHQEANQLWYPKEVVGQVQFQFKQKGVVEQWALRQLYSISEIDLDSKSPILPEHIFDPGQDIDNQVYNPEKLGWDSVNVVE